MNFLAILKLTESGADFVVVISADYEDTFDPPKREWILQMLDYLRDSAPDETFFVGKLNDINLQIPSYLYEESVDCEHDLIEAFEAGQA
jgi:hypothetical protein